MKQSEKTIRSGFGGAIPDHAYTEDASVKWQRGHEKRELKAYLKGHTHFAHGRRMTVNGFVPVMYKVREVRKAIPNKAA